MIKKIIFKILNSPVALRIRLYPYVNRLLFWAKDVTCGCNCLVYNKISLIGKGEIVIGDNFMMTSGDGINPISSNFMGCFYTEPGAKINIGDNVGMSATRMWIRESLTIGNNVNVGANVLFIDNDCHQLDYRMRRHDAYKDFTPEELQKNVLSAPIVVEDDVWIGAHTVVLKGVTIGARCVIGAGSVVTKSIPSDCIAAGNPCRVIRKLGTDDKGEGSDCLNYNDNGNVDGLGVSVEGDSSQAQNDRTGDNVNGSVECLVFRV